MSHERLYWLCQVGGWGTWFATNLGINRIARPLDLPTVVSLGVVALGGLLATHAFRTVARRRGWIGLPRRRLVPLAAASVLGIGLVVGPLAVEASYATDPAKTAEAREQIAQKIADGELAPTVWLLPYVLMSLNVMVYVTGWMLVYVGTHLSRRAAEAEADRLRAEQAATAAERDRLQTDVALAAARMRALEYQLNPHFLFNALNTVRALVHTDEGEADRAVTKLSGLLRRTLAAGREVAHPLGAELDLVRTYLDLEALRFGDRLGVEIDVDPALLDVPVPALLVQTLVENAVKHGVARRPGPGVVSVRAFACPHPRALGDGEGLCLRVENPAAADDVDPASGTGTGLANARERLALLYGEAAALDLGREGDRVVAEVRIPHTTVPSPSAPLARASADV